MWYDKYLKDNPTYYSERWIYWRNEKDCYHRENGPAIRWPCGTEHWYLNGKLHRVNGPACIWPNGAFQWRKNGKLHRVDGPALLSNDEYSWYISDENINEEVEDWTKENNYPKWKNDESWDDMIKLHFKLTFVG